MKIRWLLFLLLISTIAISQPLIISENFTTPDSVTGSGTPAWAADFGLKKSAPNSYRGVVGNGTTSMLTTQAFNTSTMTNLQLSFSHICKIQIYDTARVQISVDGGLSWTTLPSSVYLGSSSAYGSILRFASNSYTDWLPNDNQAQPNASWWKTEIFNLNSIGLGYQDVRIRFILKDGAAFPGANGNYGWVIDDIKIAGANSEITPPSISFVAPVFENYIFNNNGPFNVNATITDASGILSAKLNYKVNSGNFTTVNMINTSGNNWQGSIPAVNTNDTVNYYVEATDNSLVNNSTREPLNSNKRFITIQTASNGLYSVPFMDDFESNYSWTANPTVGSSSVSAWEYGTPNYNVTNSAYSGTKCWDINRSVPYSNNSNAVLTSPPFDFSGAYDAKLHFFSNYKTFDNKDGMRLEFSTDSGTTWQVLGDTSATKWYNTAIVGNTNKPGFTGNSGGWKYFEFPLNFLNNYSTDYVKFRFIFTSDGSFTSAGFSVDDFGITADLTSDLALASILTPSEYCAGIAANTVSAIVLNDGAIPVKDTIQVAYRINNNPAIVEDFYVSLSPGQAQTVTFTTPVNIPVGNHQFRVYTIYDLDTIFGNDLKEITFTGKALATVPYHNGFEGTNPITDFCISNEANASATLFSHQPINGNLSFVMEALDNTGWTNSSSTTNTQSWNYIWQDTVNNNNFSSTKLFVKTKGFNKLNLQFKLEQYSLVNSNETNFRILINGEQIDTTYTPDLDGYSSYNLFYDLRNYLPTDILTIEFQSKTKGSYLDQGTANVIDDIWINGIDSTLASGSGPTSPGSTDVSTIYSTANISNWPLENEQASVSFKLKNVGDTSISVISAKYLVNGIKIDSITTNTLLSIDSTVSYSFTVPFTLAKGFNTIKVISQLSNDLNKYNDTLEYDVYAWAYKQLPFSNNFDTTDGDFTNKSTYRTEWQWGEPNYGFTDSAHTGTKAWDIELDTNYSNRAKAYLYTPIFDFTNGTNPTLSFYQNRKIEPNVDALHIEYSTNGQNWNLLGYKGDPAASNWYTLDSAISTQIDGWSGQTERFIKSSIRMPQLNNAPKVQFRFVFTSNDSTTGDGVTIDDFNVYIPNAKDVGVTKIFNPINSIIDPSKAYLKVQLKNFGQDTIYSVPVTYSINGGQTVTETWTGTLVPFTVSNHTFITPFNLPGGDYEICANTSLTNDEDINNDPLCGMFYGVPVIAPIHFNTFDDTSYVRWVTSLGMWEFGTPAGTNNVINAPYSGSSCWKTKLTGNYTANTTDYLYTPYFNLSCSDSAILSFMHRYDTENSVDGGRIEYTTNSGITWTILDTTASGNWYNTTSVSSLSSKGWSGNSNGWKQVYVSLANFERKQELIRFRFRFSSNNSNQKNGWAIDDFKISAKEVYNIALTDYDFNNKINFTGDTVLFKVSGKSLAPMEIDSLHLNINIDGTVYQELFVLNPALGCNHTFNYYFNNSYIATPGTHQVTLWSETPDNNQDIDLNNDTLKFTFLTNTTSDVINLNTSGTNYCNSFEQSNPGWRIADVYNFNSNVTFSWVSGIPTKTNINGTKTGNNCFATGLTGLYDNDINVSLLSPPFLFDTSLCYGISFWHNYDMEQLHDGGTFEMSTDNGNNWLTIGNVFEENWMNAPRIKSYEDNPGWSGTSNGWVYAYQKIKPTSLNSTVFRFSMHSNATNAKDGWAIDDFCIVKLNNCTVGLSEQSDKTNEVRIYPNPTTGIANIVFNIDEAIANVTIEVYDLLGKTVSKSQHYKLNQGVHTQTIELQNLPTGMYQYVLNINGQTFSGRIIKN